MNYYANVDAALTSGDTHVDPEIVQWTPGEDNFLVPHADSPIVVQGLARAGARRQCAFFPDAGNRPGDNLVLNPAFEAGTWGWSDSSWHVSQGTNENSGLYIEVRDSDMKTRRFRNTVSSRHFRYTRGRALTLSFRARAEGEKALLNARLTVPSWHGGSGIGKNFPLSSDWRTYTWTTRLPTRFPDFAAITFSTMGGVYQLAEIKVEEGTQPTLFTPEFEFLPKVQPGMLIEPGAALKGTVVNRGGIPFQGKLSWTLEAPFHGRVGLGEAPLSTSELRTPLSISIPAVLDGGYFLCRYAFVDASGEKQAQGMFRFSVGRAARPCRHQDFFSATPGYEWLVPGLNSARQYESLQAMGLGTLHLYLNYLRMNEMLAASEAVARNLDAARNHGMKWLFTPSDSAALTGRSTWAPGPGNVGPEAIEFRRDDLAVGRCTEAQLTAWGDAIRLLASTFKGRVKYWEVLNEPNTFLTGPEYAKVLDATSSAIRANDPEAHIIAGSVVNATGGDLYTTTMAAKPGTFDSFSYHPYRFGLPNPESEAGGFRKSFLRTRQDLVAGGHKPDIFITEEGMGNAFDETRCIRYLLSHSATLSRVDWGEGEVRQAQYMARMYATALAEGGIGYNYHTLSSLLWDGLANPKLGLKVIHTMREMLGDATSMGRIDIDRDFVAYHFDAGAAGQVVALWSKDAEYAEPTLRNLPGIFDVTIRDLFGYPLPVETTQEGSAFRLGREMIYLSFKKASPDAINDALRTAFK